MNKSSYHIIIEQQKLRIEKLWWWRSGRLNCLSMPCSSEGKNCDFSEWKKTNWIKFSFLLSHSQSVCKNTECPRVLDLNPILSWVKSIVNAWPLDSCIHSIRLDKNSSNNRNSRAGSTQIMGEWIIQKTNRYFDTFIPRWGKREEM